MNINYSWFCFKRGYWPRDLECPKCQKGFLNFHEDHFVQNETVVSKEIQSEYNSTEEPNFYEGWIAVVFSAKLTCSNDRCNEVVLMVGEGQTEWDREEVGGNDPDEFYRPSYFEPHLKPILIPAKCPDNARKALCQAFRVMFISFGLACNQLRVAIEYIVDDLLGCDEKMLERKDGKFVSLDKRIEKIKIKDSLKSSKQFLLAIKFLGNTGSHEVDALTLRDFVDALALIERILNDLYSDGGSESLEDIASHINENKKPRSRIQKSSP